MKKKDVLGFPDIDGDGDVDLLDVMILNDILDEDNQPNFDDDDMDDDELDEIFSDDDDDDF